jgi:hypothetical protein
MLFEMVLLVALVPPTQPPALPDIPLALVALFPPDRFLVKGHALAARAFERGRVTATPFELDHVYVGPGVLGANSFTADLYKYQIGFSISKSGMPVEKGEPVMCWIEKTKGILTTPEVPLMPGFDLMVFAPTLREGPKEGPMARRVPENRGSDAAYDNFERGVAQYELAVTKAEVFEKIYRASEKDRLKVIDGFVRSGDSAKGAAALMLLLRGNYPREVGPAKNDLRERYTIDKHPKIAEYVLPFAKDDSLSPRVQWEVELLLRLNKERWEGSADEWKMVKRWFAGDWKEKAGVPWEVSEERFLLEDTSKTSLQNRASPRTPGHGKRNTQFRAERSGGRLRGIGENYRQRRPEREDCRRQVASCFPSVFRPAAANHRIASAAKTRRSRHQGTGKGVGREVIWATDARASRLPDRCARNAHVLHTLHPRLNARSAHSSCAG